MLFQEVDSFVVVDRTGLTAEIERWEESSRLSTTGEVVPRQFNRESTGRGGPTRIRGLRFALAFCVGRRVFR